MKNVLLITSSPRGDASFSTQIATDLAEGIEGAHVTVRELWRDPLPHIGPRFVHSVFTPEGSRTPEQREALALSDALIAELKAADIVVVGAGMINFGMPSTLKSWIDHVTRAGLTFRYGEAGPEGLVTGKKTILVLATGGVYSAGPTVAMNHLEPHLRTTFDLLGLTDVETIRIEGVALGPETTERSLAEARAKAEMLAASYSAGEHQEIRLLK
jgi:FMN-dependent NADH-azoreductase